jgi:type I restriction-modification system DNA methylase subunit
VSCILLSNNQTVNEIDSALKKLHESDSKNALEIGLTLAQSILALLVSEVQAPVEDIVADGLMQMPNAERQDAWFVGHPWMDGAKAAFDIFDGTTIPLQAKFFWLKKKTAAQIAGAVHFTANWEDFEYTRQGSGFKVGIDFFLSPDAKSLFIVLSNSGKLRVMEVSEKLNRTQVEIFERWQDISQFRNQLDVHSALWQSFELQSVNALFYTGVSDAFLELVDSLVKSGKGEQDAKLFSSRLLGRLIFTWFLRKMELVAGPIDYFNPAEFESDSSYYKESLEALFFSTLNEPAANRAPIGGVIDLETPYLNGGLFAPHENDWTEDDSLNIPRGFFSRLFQHFQNFNFTVDESTPEFEQVAIDPEMLGRVFESLLATQVEETGEQARKAKGTFYTPREVVFFMCRESISTYLVSKKPGDDSFAKSVKHLLETTDQDWAKSGTNSLRDIPKLHRDLVLASVNDLKTLDPACGSGAFPLGLLSVLTRAVMRLTPEANQHEVKSKILRNSIFGSDIEPMAIEISKLRAWLSLIVEETSKPSNVQPLPNLEFKFVCANSLIHLADSNEVNLFDNGEIESELRDIRTKFFETKDPIKKSKLKERFKLAVHQETVLFGETQRSSQLRTFNPFSDNTVAGFFDPENMFGVPFFDILIGNPPYVKLEHLTPEIVAGLKSNYREIKQGKTKDWADDLYVHFIFRAFELTRQEGIVCFITSDSFVGLDSKARVRAKLLEEDLLSLVACPLETFGATIYTAIFLARKSKDRSSEYFGARFEYPDFDLIEKNIVDKAFVGALPNYRFVFKNSTLVSKLLQFPALKNFARVVDAGIHTGNVRDKVLSKELTASATKRLIQGRQISKWAVDWDSPSAKYKYCNPNYVPSDTPGTGRGGKASKHNEYWHFAGDESNHFLPERGLLRQTSDHLHAAYQSIADDGQLYTDNTLFTVVTRDPEHLKYFIGLLNSKVLNYVYQFLSSEEGKALAQVKTGLVELLPVVMNEELAPKLVSIVDELISNRRQDPGSDVADLERQLDEVVCDIYGLDDEERRILGLALQEPMQNSSL